MCECEDDSGSKKNCYELCAQTLVERDFLYFDLRPTMMPLVFRPQGRCLDTHHHVSSCSAQQSKIISTALTSFMEARRRSGER